MIKKRVHIFYEGIVQGIGFRFTADRLAGSLGLTGWVRNLDDGRVEIVCEGTERDISAFMERLAEVYRKYIHDIVVGWSAPTGEFTGFDIRFG